MGNTANIASIVLLIAVSGGIAAWAGVTPADMGLVEKPANPTPTVSPKATPTTAPTLTPEPTPVRDPDDPGSTSHTYEHGLNLNSKALEKAVLAETNRVRTSRGLGTLEWDSEVASVARAHSEDMADRDYFGHNNPEGQVHFSATRISVQLGVLISGRTY